MNKEIPTVLGLRYGPKDIEDLYKVIELAKKNSLSKSEAGKRLVNRGLTHTDNPEPIVKEKVIYKDRPVEKIVYRDRPKQDEHIQEHVGGDNQTGQHLSGDILMTRDKADPPNNTALGLKKSPKKDSPDKGSNLGGWIALGGFLALIFGPVVYSWLTKG